MKHTKVAVCGLPRSGNRLIQRMLQRHGLVAEVRHYGMRKAFANGGEAPDRAVWPLRDYEPWSRSCERDLDVLPRPGGHVLERGNLPTLWRVHSQETLRALAEWGVAVLPVSYEAILADPEGQGARILEFAGGDPPFRGWGEELVDGNAKWAKKAPFGTEYTWLGWEEVENPPHFFTITTAGGKVMPDCSNDSGTPEEAQATIRRHWDLSHPEDPAVEVRLQNEGRRENAGGNPSPAQP